MSLVALLVHILTRLLFATRPGVVLRKASGGPHAAYCLEFVVATARDDNVELRRALIRFFPIQLELLFQIYLAIFFKIVDGRVLLLEFSQKVAVRFGPVFLLSVEVPVTRVSGQLSVAFLAFPPRDCELLPTISRFFPAT